MDKVVVLCEQDRAMLHAFSKLVLQRVTGRSLNRLQLPFAASYMEANILKEQDKDRIIIKAAAALFHTGASADSLDVDAVFEDTKTVDTAFVKRLSIPSLSLTVHYEDFADIRKDRIRSLAKAVHDVLVAWGDADSFEDAVRKAYTAQQFKDVLTEVLHLYNRETKMVSRSIKFFHPFNLAVNLFSDALFDAMEEASAGLVDDCVRRLYHGDGPHA